MRVLVVYGTTEGHTRDLCEYINQVLDEHGAESTVADAAGKPPPPSEFDLCFIAASLHVGSFQASVVDYACRHHEVLAQKPAAFLAVSLAAAGLNPTGWEEAIQCVRRFTHQTAWTPVAVHHVAGAIRYSRYDFFKRLSVQYIATHRGDKTVPCDECDLTDYEALESFVLEFLHGHRDETLARNS
jgi:menaquinone-dependent protoporphyrinogen oxidase